MTIGRASDRNALAARAWRRLFDFFISTRGQRDQTLERFALTPNDAKALHSLDAQAGKPMRMLADAWGTDASNATWVVDRLERLGLAERRTIASDRRVKLVVLTPRGVKTRDEIMRAFHEPPPELLVLDRRDLRALGDILEKLAVIGHSAARVESRGPSPTRNRRARS
jgi:DNA-binding MarR family transcriptional regulator